MHKKTQMDLENQLLDSAMVWGADYFGIADLTPARAAILEQGGTEIAQYPRSISVGIALFHTIVNQLPRRPDRAVAVSYRSHCYDVINVRLDQIISRLTSTLQCYGDCHECLDICPVGGFTGQPFRAEEPRAARFDAGKCDRYFSNERHS